MDNECGQDNTRVSEKRITNCNLPEYDMNDIHHEVEVLQLFSAPMTIWGHISGGNCNGNATHKLDGDGLRIKEIGS